MFYVCIRAPVCDLRNTLRVRAFKKKKQKYLPEIKKMKERDSESENERERKKTP